MFTLSQRGPRAHAEGGALFVPPSAIATLESEPVEEALLIRHEIANLAWIIKRIA
jgi:hypothetical protein